MKCMVTFEVGPAKQKFFLHKEIACNGSPVFDSALNGRFEEGFTQTDSLEDVTPNVFRFFSEWLYSRKLSLLDHSFDNIDALSETEKKTHC